MADNNAPAPTPADPRFGVQRIYVKDSSFEAPDTPDCFRGLTTPR